MKKIYSRCFTQLCILFFGIIFWPGTAQAQCTNADFSDGNFTGWTGTYANTMTGDQCITAPSPTANAGFYPSATLTNASSIATATQNCQTLMYSPVGSPVYDAVLALNTVNLPVVWPGGASQYAARLGSTWPAINDAPDGETMSYTYTVTQATCVFTYHFACLQSYGNHASGQEPYFNISMVTSGGTTISCATYDINANDAQSIGGFDSIANDAASPGNPLLYKPWTSVTVPLNAYIGQTVTITFTTRSCDPCVLGICCTGSHYSIAYISAECGPLAVVASSPTVCGGSDLTLTAPAGAATYAWTGPGIVSGANTQVVTIDEPGEYVVNMTTFANPGNTPCSYSIDTLMVGNPSNPFANFSAPTVCAGNASTFTNMSTPTAGVTWAWDFGDGTTSTFQNPTHTYTTAGTYPVTLTITASPCSHDTTINVVVTAPPSSAFTASGPVCEGTTSTIQYTGGAPASYTYSWNFGGGTGTPDTGQGPLQISWATAGTQTITLTVSDGSCASTPTTQTVVVEPFPGMTLTPHVNICQGASTTLVASGSPTTTYQWANNPGLSSYTTGTVTANPTVSTVYSVTGTSTNCTATDTVSVSVYPNPTSTFTVQGPVCAGQDTLVTYTGNAGTQATYTWNFDGGTATPTTGQGPFQVKWATAGTETITLTVSQFGCTSQQTSNTVVVNQVPTSTFIASTPVCAGGASTVTFEGTGTDNNAVYTWSFGNGTGVPGTGQGPQTVTYSTAGTEVIWLSVTDNGCTAIPSSQSVNVTQVPTSTFTAPSPVCAFTNSNLVYTGSAPSTSNVTYNWTFDGGTASPPGVNTSDTEDVQWSSAGVYTVGLTVTENGCAGLPYTKSITVNAAPTATFTATDSVCIGAPATITYTGTGDVNGTYTWNFDGGTATPGTGIGPQSVVWTNTGTQQVILSVTENGCTSPPYTQPVVVSAIPTANFNAPTQLCAGVNGTITYTGSSDAAATFVWDFGGANIVSGNQGTKGPFTVNWGASSVGLQTVGLEVTDNGCVSLPDTAPVIINAIPVSVAGSNVTYCSGNSATLGGPSTAGYTYLWVPATGLSNAAVSNPTVSLTNPESGSAVVQLYTVTTTSQSCSNNDSVTVTVNPVPVAQFTAPAPECLNNNSFTFASQGNNLNSANYIWNFGNSATPATSVLQQQNVVYGTAGTYNVTLNVVQDGCTDSASGTVTVNGEPNVIFTPSAVEGCQNFNVCFTSITTTTGSLSYAWTFGDGGTSTAPSPCHTFIAPGFYSIGLTVTAQGGCNFDTIEDTLIHVVADPVAMFTPSATVIQQPESQITFTNQSLNAATYFWDFSNAGVNSNIIGTSAEVSPTYNFTQYGLYTVELYAYNALQCADSTTGEIKVLPPQNFFIPNAFTPDGSGANSEFFVYLQEGATLSSLQVFDRWGEKVHDGLYPWDGTYKGVKSPEGVYVYQVKIHLIDQNIDIERRGSVTLLR